MKFKFEKLEVWQLAMNYGEEINNMSKVFPESEKFNLVSQIRRATDSIALNLAEGSIGQSNLEQKRFVGYSIRSLAEVVTCLHKANNRNYINKDRFDVFYEKAFELMNKMNAFRKSIK